MPREEEKENTGSEEEEDEVELEPVAADESEANEAEAAAGTSTVCAFSYFARLNIFLNFLRRLFRGKIHIFRNLALSKLILKNFFLSRWWRHFVKKVFLSRYFRENLKTYSINVGI